MDKDLKEKWIEALRSGKYNQGKGALKYKDDEIRHCCLGVLAEELLSDYPGVSVKPDSIRITCPNGTYSDIVFLNSFSEEIGLSSGIVNVLTEMNDGDENKYSFDDIAKWIEVNL